MTKKILKGIVKSNKMQNTVVVLVETPLRHPIYGKLIKNTKRFKAHTGSKLNVGDVVTIEECRPYSSQVTWKVIKE